jgi:hypothetical protein
MHARRSYDWDRDLTNTFIAFVIVDAAHDIPDPRRRGDSLASMRVATAVEADLSSDAQTAHRIDACR